jgi:hypothetical protein
LGAGRDLPFSDSSYQGLLALHQNSQTPVKKSKLHPLTQEQKASNRVLLQKCILIEDTIRRLNIFLVLRERHRNHCKRFDLRFYLIAAICILKSTFARDIIIKSASRTEHLEKENLS